MSKKRKELTTLPPPAKRRKESHHDKSEFRIVNASLVLAVPPIFAANPIAGVQEMLDSMVMRSAFHYKYDLLSSHPFLFLRYSHSLQGVVVSHSNIGFLENVARIQRDCPFLVCRIKFDATIWSPRIGDTLCKGFILYQLAFCSTWCSSWKGQSVFTRSYIIASSQDI